MIQARTQQAQYWGSKFAVEASDIEQLLNHFLEVEQPLAAAELARVVIDYRVDKELAAIKRSMSGRSVYQPQNTYKAGSKLVFPTLDFAQGTVKSVRDGYNPQDGNFQVITVTIKRKQREFAAAYPNHVLNMASDEALEEVVEIDRAELYTHYAAPVAGKVGAMLDANDDFAHFDSLWFVKSLLAEVNVGHLHLAEAILEINEGGPLPTAEIIPHLDMDPGTSDEVRQFSLEYRLAEDDRFDQVGTAGEIAWFLHRLLPEGVTETPGRLAYRPVEYSRSLLDAPLLLLERELDDEWSDLNPPSMPLPVVLTLLFPHRWAGTLPFSARTRALFATDGEARRRVTLIDEANSEEIVAWIVPEQRYIYGLSAWYDKHSLPVGGFINLKPGPEPGVVFLGYDRRRPKREWVRLATVVDNQIHFELVRRNVGSGYDDQLIVGTDVVAALDAYWRRLESGERSIISLLAELFPRLAELNLQGTVHAKTLYSAMNMVRRLPPGPIFAELVRHPAFQPVGDHYWSFDRERWQESR